MIDFVWEDIDSFLIEDEAIREWIFYTVESENKICGDICFIFTSDSYVLNVNKQYLNHDYYTDIITFDYCDGSIIAGDIFISIDRIKDNAKHYGVSFANELKRIIIHGVLHLLGYKDKKDNDKNIMTSKEDEYLNRWEDVKRI